MKDQFDIRISKPCNEDFNTFTKTVKGGFCRSCTKEVIDFSSMSANEISDYFRQNRSKNTCGRFKAHQVQQILPIQKRNRFINFIGGACLMVLSLVSFKTASAQNTNIILKDSDQKNPKKQDSLVKNEIAVKGTVITSKDGLPLPGASVVLEGTSIGTQTNFDGYFEFPKKLKKGDILVFSYVGMETKKITIHDTKSSLNIELKVNMASCDLVLMGKVAVKEVYKSKRKN